MNNRFPLKLLAVPFFLSLLLLAGIIFLPQAALARRGEVVMGASQVERASATRGTATAPKPDKNFVKMRIRDVVPLPEADTHAVVLVSDAGDTIVPVFVDEETALAVALKLAHKSSPMPLASDLLQDVMNKLGGKLVSVKLDSMVANQFTGRVQMTEHDGHAFELAARPADALALAVDADAPVYASPEIVHDIGITKKEIENLRRKLPQGDDDGPGVGGSGPMIAPPHGDKTKKPSELPPDIQL